MAYAKRTLNEAWYYPPLLAYRYMVALALYSKCITVAEAIIVLLDAGFSDEAYGTTRTLVDIFISLRYIANKDTEERAQHYWHFFAKDMEGLMEIIRTYWPHNVRPLDERTKRAAAKYAAPHSWSGKTAKQMAEEPDTFEMDPVTGKPAVHDFAYRVIYRLTSHYVHPTVVALDNHFVQPGRDNFVVRSGHGRNVWDMAVFNTAAYVANTMVSFYRCMGDSQPQRLSTWAWALVKHLVARHR